MASARLQRRGQGGITLVEVLMSVTIMAMVLGPVGAWMILSLNTVGPVAGRFSDTSQARILNTYLSRDVGSAEIVLDDDFLAGKPDMDCLSGGGAGGAVKLQLLSLTDNTWTRIVYTETAADGTASLWRRVCANDDRQLEDETEVMRRVVPNSTDSTCRPACDEANLLHRKQVSLQVKVGPEEETVLVHATQRATVDPKTAAAVGGFAPTAVIREVSRNLSAAGDPRQLVVRFDGADSFDLLGTIVSWSWSVPGALVPPNVADPNAAATDITFSAPDDYTVQLVVTDETGQTASTTVPVTLTNRSPIASVTVTPSDGPPLTQTFNFDASASSDPDGDGVTSWQWNFGDGAQVVSGGGTAMPAVTFSDTAILGDREVTLAATDGLGAVGVWRGTITLTGGELPDIVMSPEPVVTGSGLLARVGSVGGTGSANLPVLFSSSEVGDLRWEIVRPGTDTVLWSSEDESWEHTFESADTGDFEIRMYRDGATVPSTRQFRVNAAPTAAFAGSPPGGAYPLDVAFTDTSTDDKGVSAWSWDFGFFGKDGWTSTAASPAHRFTNPGPYMVRLTVTDNDGASGTTVVGLNVTGTPPRPSPPVWQGSNVTFPALPGATRFRVKTQHVDDEGCSESVLNSTVDASPLPGPGTYSIVDPGKACTGANARSVASIEVEAGVGNWSATSNASAERPL
jgi:PKD repeat protein